MGSRRFVGANESHSFNLGVSVASMAVAHAPSSPAKPSRDREAYDSYVAYCQKVGVSPKDFSSWYGKEELGLGKSGTLYAGFLRFHGQSIGSVGRGPDPLSGLYEPPKRDWNGGWDNAVRVLEGQ